MLYDDFKPIVDLVLNNWTALQLAVLNGMGAPGGEKTAQLMSVYITRYCVENIVDVNELEEVLEDLMDEEFETTCQDGSTREIASLLLLYLGLLKDGSNEEVQRAIDAMPKCQIWLSQPAQSSAPPQTHGNPDDDTTSSDDESDDTETEMNTVVPYNEEASTSYSSQDPEPMEEDPEPGWTVVRTRRKK